MSEGYGAGDQIDPRTLGYGRDAHQRGQGGGTRGSAEQQESVGSLLSGIIQDLQEMVRGEVALARTELREDAMGMGRGVATIAAGALVGVTGFIFLMLGATYLLNKWVQMWIAAAIVGVVLAVIAAIFITKGRSTLRASNLKPEQTINSLKEDKEWAKQQMSSVKR